ncbi:MAG: DNA-3-methyladenine glycosylase [Coriobacteriia bacterium]|nr:DNA-3-methyladenine glycosylase [Coriobacteriia bacterium]
MTGRLPARYVRPVGLDPERFGVSLSQAFFERSPLEVAPDLLGCIVASTAEGTLVAGRIVETEAYLGRDDPGSHAATKGMTVRNAVMYGPCGCAYVYFTYGAHHMLNFVCGPEGTAGAVLLRALEPIVGQDAMSRRRGKNQEAELCSGPGKLAAALAVDLSDNGIALGTDRLSVYAGTPVARDKIRVSGRIGLSKGHELPYRFYEAGSPYVSRGRTGAHLKSKR